MNYDQKMFQFQQVPNNGAYINAQPVNIQYRFDPGQQIIQQQQPPQIHHQVIHQQPQHIQVQAAPQPQPAPAREGKCPVRGKTSPYGFFVKMCYEEHKKKYPGENVQVTEISKKCAEKWKTMNDEEKKRFYELAQKDADRYTAEISAYGGEDAVRKKKRAKKDPNAPKRALSAFFFFSNENRPEVQSKHPEWKVGQVAQELGRMWKALTEEQKAVYEEKANMDKQRYADEMRTYRGQPSSAQSPPHEQGQTQQQVAMKQEVAHATPQPQHQMQPQIQHQQPQMVVIQAPPQSQSNQQPQQQPMQQMHVQMLAQPGEM